MTDIIHLLGLTDWRSLQVAPHHHHFHVDLQVPNFVKIGGASLLLSTAGAPNQSSTEETVVLPMDMPPPTDFQTPPALIAQATPVVRKYDAVLGECTFVEDGGGEGVWDYRTAINSITPLGAVGDYLKSGPDERLNDVRVTVLTPPKHGLLRLDPIDPARGKVDNIGAYHYFPNDPDYRGKDQMTFEVEANGKRFKVIVTVYVVGSVDHVPNNLEKRCPLYYRISSTADDTNLKEQLIEGLWSVDSLQRLSDLESLVAVASAVTLVFSELPGAAVGQTAGTGPDATITLDHLLRGQAQFPQHKATRVILPACRAAPAPTLTPCPCTSCSAGTTATPASSSTTTISPTCTGWTKRSAAPAASSTPTR